MIYTCVSDTKTQPCCVSLHIYVCFVGFCFHFLRLFIAFASAFLIHVIKTIGWFFYPDISIEIKFNSVIFLTINWYWTTSNWKIICELVAYYRLTQLYMRTHTCTKSEWRHFSFCTKIAYYKQWKHTPRGTENSAIPFLKIFIFIIHIIYLISFGCVECTQLYFYMLNSKHTYSLSKSSFSTRYSTYHSIFTFFRGVFVAVVESFFQIHSIQILSILFSSLPACLSISATVCMARTIIFHQEIILNGIMVLL